MSPSTEAPRLQPHDDRLARIESLLVGCGFMLFLHCYSHVPNSDYRSVHKIRPLHIVQAMSTHSTLFRKNISDGARSPLPGAKSALRLTLTTRVFLKGFDSRKEGRLRLPSVH